MLCLPMNSAGPVFEDAGKLDGRIGLNPTPLFRSRSDPRAFGGLVAGAGYGLFLACRSRPRIK